MIFAFGQPASLAGLAAALLLGLGIRHIAQALAAHEPVDVLPHWRRDIDPVGVLAAVFGGIGWGGAAPGTRGRARTVLVCAVGPVSVLACGLAVLAVRHAVFPDAVTGSVYRPSDVLRGVPGQPADQLLFSVGVGMVCFAVVACMPLPPCDGWTVVWRTRDRHGTRALAVRDVLDARKIGAVVLLVALALPIGGLPPLHRLLDLLVTPLIRFAG